MSHTKRPTRSIVHAVADQAYQNYIDEFFNELEVKLDSLSKNLDELDG